MPHGQARDDAHRCTGKIRNGERKGERCRRPAIAGGFVCAKHGAQLPCVRKKARERLAEGLANLIDPDRALREAARLAYSDIRQLFDENGKLLPVKQWPDDLAAAVGGVEIVRRNVDSNDGQTDDVLKVKVWDKPKALEMLFKHLGLLKEVLEHSGGITVKWQE